MQRSDGTSDFWSNFFIWIYIGKSDFGIRINHWAHFKTHNPRNTKKVLIPKSLPTASYIRSEDSQVSPRRSFSATRFLYACWFDLGIPMAVIKTCRARAIRMRKCYLCQTCLTAIASSWGPSFLYCYHCRGFFVPYFYAEATVEYVEAPGSGDEAPGSGDEAPGSGDKADADDGFVLKSDNDDYIFLTSDDEAPPGSGDEAPGSGDEAPGSGDEADADDGFVLKSDDDDYIFLKSDDEFPGTGDEAEDDPLYYKFLVMFTEIPFFPEEYVDYPEPQFADDSEEYFPRGGVEYSESSDKNEPLADEDCFLFAHNVEEATSTEDEGPISNDNSPAEVHSPKFHYLVHCPDIPVEAFDPADDGAGHQDPDILLLNLVRDPHTRVWFY
ncbi:hypothetical protein L1049_008314 [Liquidambar formosana]|uniref:Uncharacterized protein n=1 Tax=Liquidambar formosana TaxID=63359 RepID=A0AAP0S3C6_LIQFO